jgi:hypothetical protein
MEKFDSGIRDKHPGSATLGLSSVRVLTCLRYLIFFVLRYLIIFLLQVQDQGARIPAPGHDGPHWQEPHARRHCGHHRHHGCRLWRGGSINFSSYILPSLKKERGVYTVGTTGGDDISFLYAFTKNKL